MSMDMLPVEEIAEPLQGLLQAGHEVVITSGGRPTWICKKVADEKENGRSSGFGVCKGMLVVNAEDDEHLADFAEYMS
jgi:hypothetical protein